MGFVHNTEIYENLIMVMAEVSTQTHLYILPIP